MPWFIDAWAGADGLAFASQRDQDASRSELTVYLAPPAFHPVPVASRSTALWSTRSSFQEGFLDENGAEVPFAALDDVIEAVRRVFRAGGHLQPPPAGVPFPPTTPLPSNDGSLLTVKKDDTEPEHLRHAPDESVRRESVEITRRWWPRSDRGRGGERKEVPSWEVVHSRIAARQGTTNRAGLPVALVRFMDDSEVMLEQFSFQTLDSLLARLEAKARPAVSELDCLNRWVSLLSGAWISGSPMTPFDQLSELLHDNYASLKISTGLVIDAHSRRVRSDSDSSVLRGTLFEVPFPPTWLTPRHARVTMYSIGDMLSLGMSDHSMLRAMCDPMEFVPLALIARVIVGECFPRSSWVIFPGSPHEKRLFTELRARTAAWLSESLPDARLLGHYVEEAITNFPLQRSRGRDGGNNEPPLTPGPGRPGGSPLSSSSAAAPEGQQAVNSEFPQEDENAAEAEGTNLNALKQ